MNDSIGEIMRARQMSILVAGIIMLLMLMPSSFWPQPVTGRGTIKGKVMVGSGNRSINLSEVVVSVEDIVGDFSHQVPDRHPVIDQRGLTFVPHVLPVLAGTTVAFPNSDPVSHNVFSISAAKRFNLGMYPTGGVKSITFDNPGRVDLRCNVHREMHAIILVKKNPCFTTCDKQGGFSIPGVPAGNRKVQAWHEQFEPAVQEVSVPANGTVWLNFHLTQGVSGT